MTFENLDAWNTARKLVKSIYSLTGKEGLARDYALSGQIRRAGISTMSNVAEGFERYHIPEKLQFYNVARASNGEVRSLLYVIENNFPARALEAVQLRADVVTVGKLVNGLWESTQARTRKPRA